MLMDEFLTQLWEKVRLRGPELLPLYKTMAEEAKFARALLENNLKYLPRDAKLLEVGGGVMILAAKLATEGFDITVIEPAGQGFGEFEKLRDIILEVIEIKPRIVTCYVEDFISDERFDYAFSINVMEHVGDPQRAIARVSATLKPQAVYRFFCPNYLFPYEPHFNIPIIFTKNITQGFFRDTIASHSMGDPQGLWESLNWITVLKVRRWVKQDPTLSLDFRKATTVWILERVINDPEFASRRSAWIVKLIRLLVTLQLHQLVHILPATLHPIMDVRLDKC